MQKFKCYEIFAKMFSSLRLFPSGASCYSLLLRIALQASVIAAFSTSQLHTYSCGGLLVANQTALQHRSGFESSNSHSGKYAGPAWCTLHSVMLYSTVQYCPGCTVHLLNSYNYCTVHCTVDIDSKHYW